VTFVTVYIFYTFKPLGKYSEVGHYQNYINHMNSFIQNVKNLNEEVI